MKKSHINFILIILSCLFCFIKLNAQTNNTKDFKSSSYLTISLLSPINPYSPRWKVGYIKNITNNWKVGLDIGYGNHKLSFSDFGDKISTNYQIWEIRSELYYILRPERKTKKYFSLELFYINHTDIFYNGYYFPENGESLSYDRSNFKRQKYGFNLKYGFIIYSRKRFGFNLYTGLGPRIRKNTFSKVINPSIINLDPEGGDMFGLDDYKNTEGSNLSLNFSLGFKLYYRI